MAEGSTTGHGLARAIWASSLCAFSVVLLVAGKTTAGVAFVGMALILVGPLRRLVASERRRAWVGALAIAALLAVATAGIAGTDIRPDQHRTGFAPVDKVAAIVDDFVAAVSGQSGTPARRTGRAPPDARTHRRAGVPGTAPAAPEDLAGQTDASLTTRLSSYTLGRASGVECERVGE